MYKSRPGFEQVKPVYIIIFSWTQMHHLLRMATKQKNFHEATIELSVIFVQLLIYFTLNSCYVRNL